MKKYFFLLLLISAFTFLGNAQQWKHNPSSIVYANGTNNFMGDLGGGKTSAAHFFGLRDLDLQVTRPTWQIGYRRRIHEIFVFRTSFSYALLSGSDANSGSPDRWARNLSFRSSVYELSTQIEYYFIKEKGAQKSSFRSLKGFSPISAYFFFGGGAFYYNPKAKHPTTGEWIALQPLGTEGQYANPDGTPYTYTSSYVNSEGEFDEITVEPYKRIAGVFSVGIGMKYDLNKLWSIGFELSNRYTTTDYLDDVSDRYFNYAEHGLTPPSEYTTLFSDRHYAIDYSTEPFTVTDELGTPYLSGKTMRGEPKYQDAYIFGLITVYYKIGGSGRSHGPRKY